MNCIFSRRQPSNHRDSPKIQFQAKLYADHSYQWMASSQDCVNFALHEYVSHSQHRNHLFISHTNLAVALTELPYFKSSAFATVLLNTLAARLTLILENEVKSMWFLVNLGHNLNSDFSQCSSNKQHDPTDVLLKRQMLKNFGTWKRVGKTNSFSF